MRKFTIKNNYEYEIEGGDAQEAVEKWCETIEDELAVQNKTLLGELLEYIYAEDRG